MEPTANSYKDFDELLFEGKNKEYGAYMIRKKYLTNVLKGFIVTSILLVIGVTAPLIAKKIAENMKKVAVEKTVEVKLEAPPPMDETQAQETPKIELPKIETIRFTIPEVDDEVTEVEEITTQEDLKESNAGVTTQDGMDFSDLPPDTTSMQIVQEDIVFESFAVEQQPMFPGGEEELQIFIKKNLVYPQEAIDNGIEGKVYVEFVVSASGAIQKVKVLKGIGAGCDTEAVRVVKNMPAWNPGKQNGKPVSVKFMVPIVFKLQ